VRLLGVRVASLAKPEGDAQLALPL